MSLEVSPEYLPVISAQVSAALTEALQSISAGALMAIPAPPGSDFVSPQLTAKASEHAAKYFPGSLQGIGYGADAAAVLPTIGAAYQLTDLLGEIDTQGPTALFG